MEVHLNNKLHGCQLFVLYYTRCLTVDHDLNSSVLKRQTKLGGISANKAILFTYTSIMSSLNSVGGNGLNSLSACNVLSNWAVQGNVTH